MRNQHYRSFGPLNENFTNIKSSIYIRGGTVGDMGDGSTSSHRFQVSSYAVKGGRSYMEDEHIVKNGGRFAAVFDGHGGSAVSLYLRQNLYASYLQSISKITTTSTPKSTYKHNSKSQTKNNNPPSLQECIKAFRSAFRDIDNQVQQVSHWSYQGSTAVAVYLYERPLEREEQYFESEVEYDTEFYDDYDHTDNDDDKRKSNSRTSIKQGSKFTLVSFNVGDSRAILSRDATAITLTTDHKPNDPSERRRIEKLGGQVTWCGLKDRLTNKPIKNSGVYRMNGNLALSRAIGDRSERPWVSATVDVKVIDLNLDEKGGDEFIVLGSDGLWDVMDNQEVVNFVHELMQEDDETGISINSDNDLIGLGAVSNNGEDSDVATEELREKTKRDRIRILQQERKREKHTSAARLLTEEALRRGSTDNITTVIIWLDKEKDEVN